MKAQGMKDAEKKQMNVTLTGKERIMDDGDILVSMTDLKSRVVYANKAFLKIAGYTQEELVGKPHNVVRHPLMPRSAFKDFWQTLQAGKPWNGLVVNRATNGDHYWVDANVAPRFENGNLVGYMSVRRKPQRDQIEKAARLYRSVLEGKATVPSSLRKRMSLKAKFWLFLVFVTVVVMGLGLDAAFDLLHGKVAVGLSVVFSVLTLAVGAGLSNSVLRPIKEAADYARLIATGDLSVRIPHDRNDEVGDLFQALLSMLVNTAAVIGQIKESVESLDSAAGNLTSASTSLSAGLDKVAQQSETFAGIASAATQMNTNLQSVTSSTEEMSISIQEVARKSSDSATVAEKAQITSREMNSLVKELGVNARDIGKVIESISEIASQTNLLALNAAIEAAGAGDAGKGFAVVASEVKELARQSAESSEEIKDKIGAIQGSTENVIAAIGSITSVISQINEIAGSIASAVEEQAITTREIASNINQTAQASNDVTASINNVSTAVLSGAQESASFTRLA
ncbi:MAG TPA: PAS domain-containing methyl-accepting chemotaxis protein, partial [Leptospiraceae bacterium]|nr:PAS domain-containing methyl-accepting chemotaxis protein [Leptospiraceae bacterium]